MLFHLLTFYTCSCRWDSNKEAAERAKCKRRQAKAKFIQWMNFPTWLVESLLPQRRESQAEGLTERIPPYVLYMLL